MKRKKVCGNFSILTTVVDSVLFGTCRQSRREILYLLANTCLLEMKLLQCG